MKLIRPLILALGCLGIGLPLQGADFQAQPSDKEMSNGCWVEIFEDDKYDADDPHVVLKGPMESATLKNLNGRDWNNDIESLIVGPKATVYAYKDKDFKDTEIVFAPNQRVPDLSALKMGNNIESLKVKCAS